MLYDILSDSLKEKKLVCFSLDLGDLETVVIGRVRSFDNKYLFLDEVNPYGVFIRNNRRIRLSKIKLVCFDDIYGKDLEFLVENCELQFAKAKYLYFSDKRRGDENSFLKFLKNGKIVSLFTENDYFIGVITQYDGKYVLVNNFTFQGFEDGVMIIEKKLITKIRYDGPLEQKVEVLKKIKN